MALEARERILEAADEELAAFGPTLFRLGHVAEKAGVKAPYIYKHFRDREELIALATARHIESTVAVTLEAMPGELPRSMTRDDLLSVFRTMILQTQTPERVTQRRDLLDAIAIANHNDVAKEHLGALRHALSQRFLAVAQQIEARGLLAPGVTALTFARFWFSVLFGQVICELDDTFATPSEEWVEVLMSGAAGLFAEPPPGQDDPSASI